MAIYRCKRCNFLYIDEKNEKPFENLDENSFKCPRCKCSKKLFDKVN